MLLLSIVISLMILSSCVPFEKPQDRSHFILSEDGSPVSLALATSENASLHFYWYECSDKNGSNPTLVSEDAVYTTSDFTQPEVLYIRGESRNDADSILESKLFYVAYTGLPCVRITTLSGSEITSKRDYVPASISISGTSTPFDKTDITIKGRGSSSWLLMTKKSYTFKLEEKTKILGMAKGKKWALVANQIDLTKISNMYASYLGNNVFHAEVNGSRQWEPSMKAVNLIVNGEYRGIYTLSEVVKIDKKRIDIPDIAELTSSDEDLNHDGKTDLNDGGFVIECTRDSNGFSFTTLHGVTVDIKDPDLDEATGDWTREQIREHIRKKVNLLEQAILGESATPFTDLIDLDSMVSWYLTNEFIANNEASFKSSCFLYYDPEYGKFVMGPNWDLDRGLTFRHADRSITVTGDSAIWYKHLIKEPVFIDAVKTTWNEKKEDLQDSFAVAISYSENIRIAAIMDTLRWDCDFHDADMVESWLNTRLDFMDCYINAL